MTDRFPHVRLRRLRQNAAWRSMLSMTMPGPEKFIWPIFVVDGGGQEIAIDSMPGQSRYSVDRLAAAVAAVAEQGVGGVLLFGVLKDHKDNDGSYAFNDNGVVQNAIRELRREFPDLLIMTDVCVCGYTDHGHCGILTDDGDVDNDASLEVLAKMAVSHAAAGADAVAPSAMMDGQVQAIRAALDGGGHEDTVLMSYSTKFASAMYGPFRDAAQSAPGKGDRQSYQAPTNDPRQAIRESLFDIDEGADILMVKPALFYLDIICRIRAKTDLPIAAYNVSGEYGMLHAAAKNGCGELDPMVRESVTALVRAGADIIITYWANQYARIFQA